jgi:8-oxo-dGTP pyrophosphatase MutT (NUDIX family)
MEMMMIQKWKKISAKQLGDFKIFSLWENISVSPRNGKQFPFLVLNTNDWINVIPITEDGKVIVIKQYRHGSEDITLEIPGGMVDDNDVSAAEAARRELLEETGYAGEELIELGICSPNPAIFNNKLHIFFARNVKQVSIQEQDGAEDIEVIKVGIEKIPKLIKSGEINHALVVAAFHLFNESEYSKFFKTKKNHL